MKRISIVLLFIFILTFSSCSKTYQSFDNSNKEEFFNLLYEDLNNSKTKFVAFDFRSKETYESGHARPFQNYVLENGSVSDFITKIKTTNSHKTRIYLWLNSSEQIDEFQDLQQSFDKVYLLVSSYEECNDIINDLFVIDVGEYNCGC